MTISAARRSDNAALLAGALLPLAFSPLDLFPLTLLSVAMLFTVWRGADPGRAAWRGFLFGLGMYGVGVSWVYVSLHDFGYMPAPLAGAAVALFVAGLALFPAALGALQAWLAHAAAPVLHGVLMLPALWVLFEWVRGWLFGGFPWLLLGYAQVDNPLAGYAPWIGVYGVSFAVALSAGLFAQARLNPRKFWVLHLPLLVAIWAGGWAAGQVPWVHPVDAPLNVALIQGNVPLVLKWQPEERMAIVERYLRASEGVTGADLVVWPEAAVPGYLDRIAPELLPQLDRLHAERDVDFVFGVLERDAVGAHYNSVLATGDTIATYRKRHLVPFGEFLPLPELFGGLIDYLKIPMSDFTPGADRQGPLPAAGQWLGVSVCYEDAFGEEIIGMLPRATVLVNLSEDAWFGNSLAPHQRIQMARMRALESGRPLLRAANTGPSVVIDHGGNIVARAPQFEAHTLSAVVQPMQGLTPYARFGNTPVVCACVLLVLAVWRVRRALRVAPETHV